jgi:hypothetical protein
MLYGKLYMRHQDFWNSLPDYINNSCTTGFIIEQAILSRIAHSGLNVAGKDIHKPMSVQLFSGSFPNFRIDTTNPILYCPMKFNYRGIDGIIARIEPELPMTTLNRRKLFMYPLQITLAPDKHSDSHKAFLSDYECWTRNVKDFDVAPTFLWISPEVASPKLHEPTDEDNWPAHCEEYVPISQVHSDLWAAYESVKHWHTRGAPEPPAHGDGRVLEEPEGPREQVRSDWPDAAAGPSGGDARGNRGRGSGSQRMGGIGHGDRREVYQSMSVNELRQTLKVRELRRSGIKDDLVNRLVEDDRQKEAT